MGIHFAQLKCDPFNSNFILMKNEKIKYPDLTQTTTLFIAFLVINLILALPQFWLPDAEGILKDWLVLSNYIISMLVMLLFADRMSRVEHFDYGMALARTPDWLFWLLIPAMLSIFLVVDRIVGLIPMSDEMEQRFADMVSTSVPSFLTVVIAAPILEELLCRGVVLRGLLNHMPPYRAILWSSLFFALLHLNPWQGVAAFLIGFFSGWIFWKTRSIVPCIFIHLLNNGVGFLILMLAGEQTEPVTLVGLLGMLYYWLVSAAMIVGFITILIIYFKYEKTEDNNYEL